MVAMNLHPLRAVGIALGTAALVASSGCTSKKPEYLPPPNTVPEATSSRTTKKAPKEPRRPSSVSALVAYGTDGKPVYVELRESTGDPVLDQRAVDLIMKHRTFPPGKADTILVPVDVKSIHRE